jgi:hypothetical protein
LRKCFFNICCIKNVVRYMCIYSPYYVIQSGDTNCLSLCCRRIHLTWLPWWVRITLTERCTRYNIEFVNDLRQIGGFLRVLRFPPPILEEYTSRDCTIQIRTPVTKLMCNNIKYFHDTNRLSSQTIIKYFTCRVKPKYNF